MTSTTKTITTTLGDADKAKLQADIDAAEAAQIEAFKAIAAAEAEAEAALAEHARVEKCISEGDPTAGLEDLVKADSAKRFHELAVAGKKHLAAGKGLAIREAKLAKLIAGIEHDGRITSKAAMNAEGLALAKEFAPLVKAFVAKMEAHNEARLEAIKYASQTNAHDAVNGYGASDSRVIYGERNFNRDIDLARTTPEFIELDGKPILELASWVALEEVLEAVKHLVESTPAELETYDLLPFRTVHADGSRPHEWTAPIAA